MSNKNLKIYKMQFITEVKKLYLNIKFPCNLKLTWKRSESIAESSNVPLETGIANFNQILKLNVNMYFDTVLNKFVQKKCLYSFIIVTQKGQKSAGSVTMDLAQFFNKRVYEINQTFPLEKCPVPGAKVEMKIFYEEEASEQGYDSMSCISATNPMDSSVSSVDINDLNPNKTQSQLEIQTQKSSNSQKSMSQTDKAAKSQYIYQKLNASDVVESQKDQKIYGNGNIGDNIKNLNSLTNKINAFVNDKSKSIRFQIQNQRRKIQHLQENNLTLKLMQQKLQSQIAQEKKKFHDLQKQHNSYKLQIQQKLIVQMNHSKQLQLKCNNSDKMLIAIQAKMSQSGQSQSNYIQDLKNNYAASQAKFKADIDALRSDLLVQQKAKAQLNTRLSQSSDLVQDLKSKLHAELQKNNVLEEHLTTKQAELQRVRLNLQKAFENLVNSFNSLV